MTPIIEANNITFNWPNSEFKLLIKQLSVSKAEKIFIQGPSGCGKSTLLSLLCGVNLPNSGKLTIFNTDLNTLSSSQRDQFRADHIGIIFQQFNLLPYLTALENVLLACDFSPMRKQRILNKSLCVKQEAERLLSNLEISNKALLKKPINELSVGQQQRVAAARALIGSPEIIIADEPTSSLDAVRCNAFMKLLIEEAQACEATLLFVSHDERLRTHFDSSLTLCFNDVTNTANFISLSKDRDQK